MDIPAAILAARDCQLIWRL